MLFGDTPNIILDGAKFPAHSVQDVVDWAKKNPGRLTIGHPGPGTMGHLAALLLASNAGITGTYISYRNVSQMVVDLLGGQIDIGVAAYTPQHKAARILAVMTPDPVAFCRACRRCAKRDFPASMPRPGSACSVRRTCRPRSFSKLNAVVNAFAHDAEAQKRLGDLGFRMIGGIPGDLTKRINRGQAAVVQGHQATAGVKLNDQK